MKPDQVIKVKELVRTLVYCELECAAATKHKNEQQEKLNALLQECVKDDPRNATAPAAPQSPAEVRR